MAKIKVEKVVLQIELLITEMVKQCILGKTSRNGIFPNSRNTAELIRQHTS